MVVAGPAGAADPDLVEEALATLGIDDAPAGLVDDIASLLPDDIGADADVDSDAATRLEEAVRNWEIVAPEWRDVPEGLMAQVRECRDETTDDPVDESDPTETTIAEGTDESDDTTETTVAEGDDGTDESDDTTETTVADGATVEECGEQLRVRLRIEHAERLVARFTERIAEAEGLPEQARAEVIAAMTAVRDRAEQRLRDIVENEDDAVDAVLEATGRDRAVLARVQEQVAEQAGELNRRSEQANAAPGRGSDTADTDDTDGGPDTDGGTGTDDSDGDRNDDDRPGQGEGTANTTVPERSGGQGGDAEDAGDDDRGNSGDAPGRTTVVDDNDSDSDEADDPQDSDGRSEGRPDDNGRSDQEGNGR